MTTDQTLQRIRPIIDEWPMGTLVWHRASGTRGVVVEYLIDANGGVNLGIDYGKGAWDKETPASLSGTRILPDVEGDEWKQDGTDSEGKEPRS